MEAPPEVVANSSFLTVQPTPAVDTLSKTYARYDNTIEETPWSPAKIMAREQLFARQNWSVTEPAGVSLQTGDTSFPTLGDKTFYFVPFDFYNNDITRQLMQTFTYYRADFHVTVTVTGTKFHSGAVVTMFKPLTVDPVPDDEFNSPFMLEHVLLEACGVNTGVLHIPYRSFRSYLSTYDNPSNFNLGVLQTMVISPLQAATGAATEIPITYTWHASSTEFYVPSLLPTNVFPETQIAFRKKREVQRTRREVSSTPIKSDGSVLRDALFKAVEKAKVVGEPHSGEEDVQRKAADDTIVPTVGGPSKVCSHDPSYDSPESIRDCLKRMGPVGSGNLVNLAQWCGITLSPSSAQSKTFLMGYMDAAAIFNGNWSMHPASYWSSMYGMARGSIRYTFTCDFAGAVSDNSSGFTYGGLFIPGYVPPVNVSGETDSTVSRLIMPGTGRGASEHYNSTMLAQPMLDALNFLPRMNQYCVAPDNFEAPPQFYSNQTGGATHVVADQGHNSFTMDIPFVSRLNAYKVREVREILHANVGNPTIDTVSSYGPEVKDYQLDSSAYTTSPTGGQVYMDGPWATMGADLSPGTIFIYAIGNVGMISPGTFQTRRMNVSVYGALGDDFRFGVLKGPPNLGLTCINPRIQSDPPFFHDPAEDEPLVAIPQFGMWGCESLKDGLIWPPRGGTIEGQPHGNTITTINKFKNAANVTLPVNVTGDRFDTNAEFKTALMDKPTNTLGAVAVMPNLASPMPNQTGIVNGTRMALRADETFECNPELFGTDQDEMDLCFLTRIMTPVENGTSSMGTAAPWDTAMEEGTKLFEIPLSPTPVWASSPSYTTEVYRSSLLSQISSNFLYWNGSLRFRIKLFATQFHTGRLFIGVSYYPDRDFALSNSAKNIYNCSPLFESSEPQTMTTALNQGGVYLDLAEGTRDVVIDVPYKCMFPRLDVGTKLQPHQKSMLGKLTCFIVNPLTAPENVAQEVGYITLIGGGPDFKLMTLSPFAAALDMPRPFGNQQGLTPWYQTPL